MKLDWETLYTLWQNYSSTWIRESDIMLNDPKTFPSQMQQVHAANSVANKGWLWWLLKHKSIETLIITFFHFKHLRRVKMEMGLFMFILYLFFGWIASYLNFFPKWMVLLLASFVVILGVKLMKVSSCYTTILTDDVHLE